MDLAVLLTKYYSDDHIVKNGMDGVCSTYCGDVYKGFWWGNLRERDHLEDPDLDGRIVLKRIFRKWDGGAWTGLIWLRMGTGSGHL
jgi:hypothetical protein